MTTMRAIVQQRLQEGTLLVSPVVGGFILGRQGMPVFVRIDEPDPFPILIAQIETALGCKLPRLGKPVHTHGFSFSLQMHRNKHKLTITTLDDGSSHQHLSLIAALGAFGNAPAHLY